ncbi:MAG TPA: PadR family transcriptional regulator [Gemmatimonadaceae bacterium]
MPPSLPEFELAVLLTIARLHDDAYGVRIWREVNTIRGHEYAIGAIYTVLQRLEDKGFAISRMGESQPVRGGRSRRHYRLTAAGQRAIRQAREAATRLWNAGDLGTAH